MQKDGMMQTIGSKQLVWIRSVDFMSISMNDLWILNDKIIQFDTLNMVESWIFFLFV